ncbi:armadillo repeat-containing protein 7 isoform X2 [Conger conger]|uniref:armadillo repeat-containing protein 7 isoform X1 n=1 Tax=Conger conger TaxID=82655 RepID=UPI002A59B9D3|nr:armadillo repeat-containing protein 7 isoform X1 [Conger conger]XP_061081393.1 armadillo repeat-containing protein 7 isoform X2 [Conger conger]
MSGRGRFPGPDRFEYLQALVTEFQDTDSSEAREQVLANLANFSYDPRNMEDLLRLQVTELFLDMLTEESENLVEFGIGGLCNLSVVPACRDQVLQSDGVALVTGCLSSRREETVLSAIGTLMNLATAAAWRDRVTDPAVLHCMLRFSLSQSARLRGLACVFLQDCCSPAQVERAQRELQGNSQTALGIPLPQS